MSDPFVQPAPASTEGPDFQTLRGALLLIKVISQEAHVPTVHTLPGEKSPAVVADITVLDGQRQGEQLVNTLIFPKVLQTQLCRSIGQTVLGRLTQGEAKQGKNAPWQLDPASADDASNARRYLDARASQPVGAPAASAEPPF